MAKKPPVLTLLKPTLTTLKKYGLSEQDWEEIADRQDRVCAVCKRLTSTGRLCIDHFHAPKWKKMPPAQRKLYVRGLLCWRCNTTFVGRGINIDIAKNVARYLEDYEARWLPKVVHEIEGVKVITNEERPRQT